VRLDAGRLCGALPQFPKEDKACDRAEDSRISLISAKLGILPKKKVDLLSTSPPPTTPGQKATEENDDPNPSIPSAHKSLVEQIPKTPPANKDNMYSLGDSDDDLEYTK
jgi:hypothetical protein